MVKTYGQKSHHILRSVFGDLVKNKEADECLLLCLDLTGHSSSNFLYGQRCWKTKDLADLSNSSGTGTVCYVQPICFPSYQ